jgi:Zn-dependent protease
LLLSGDRVTIAQLLASAIVLLIAMDIHEVSHNFVGYWMGDPTPREMRRLTLNPMVHINWIGWLMWVAVGFGILGSAPINGNRMRNPRWGYLAAVAAGPFSNLALAALSALLFRVGLFHQVDFGRRDIIPNLNQIMGLMVQFNLLLFVFNLIPVYPFDGWHILLKLLPPQQALLLERYQQQSMYIFLGLLLLSFVGLPLLDYIYGPPYFFLYKLLMGL